MIQSSLYLMVLLIAWITIFSLTSSVSGLGSFTHNEMNPFETKPRIWKYLTYFDGTVVLRIINRNPNITSLDNEAWIRPVLSLRIIHPNGTVSEIDKDLEIPEFNWHITISPDGYLLDPVNIYALQKGFLLFRYFNASNPDDINTYEEWGRIIDWNGNLYDNVYFSKANIENGTWYPTKTSIVNNVNPEKGFIKIYWRVDYVEWQQYTIDDAFNFIKLSYGNLSYLENTTAFNVMGTVDDGYSIIMGISTSSDNDEDPLETSAAVYVLTKGYDDKQFGAPKLLYQSNLANITISNIFSGISSTGIGQVCTLNITQNTVTSSRNYYVKLNFLSSGSVTEIIPIPLSYLPVLPSNSTTRWLVASIPYGGYVFYGRFPDANNNTNVYVYYFDEYENKFTAWDSREPSVLNLRGIFIILPNNTMLISQMEDFNMWSFLTTDIPKLTNLDNNYSNLQINSTSPSINDNISTLTNNITITYYEPVELSDGNISIYQIDNSGNNIIRQFVNGIKSSDFCSISDDGLTVTVKLIKSTFSNPNSKFYVKIGSNFARSRAYKESLMGVYDVWKFNTNPIEEPLAGKVSGVLRLTIEGTEYFENLNSTGKNQFFANLHLELSKIIPINIKRLSSNGKTQVDTTVSPSRQIFISLNIEPSNEGRSVASIIDNLNEMIKYKSITSIGLNPITKYLDENFGFTPKQDLWDEYKCRFLGVLLILAILLVLFLIAEKMQRKGRNIAILHLGLIIFDFVLDVLFVSKNGKVIELLYIPSHENKSKDFLYWFSQNEKLASVFTVLSSADIEALSILHSNIAGLKCFQAPISTKGKNRIFWASCLTVFVEDIPQLIIQLIYYYNVITYDIIPLLALVSSCLSLLINIIGKLFQAINSCRPGTLEYDGQDDFQKLQTPTTERSSASDESISHSIDIKEENEKNSDKNNLTGSSKSSFQEVIL
ncbi:12_t:CDS:2 [Diversispora eburnea]|uniref:12_t:CDS:1 n=1 Tax=Diversispora eburnea TaxID=1213867 RepID=A0A9N9G9S9_9GLOM|nr:12_t:CDS:2 [Diversispora eburnea]